MDDETRKKFIIAILGVFITAIVIAVLNGYSRGTL
jgi:acyl-CoA synthetase (AMP-forming)/AMP-acid ligase II